MDTVIILLFVTLVPMMVMSISEEICELKGEYIQCPIGKVLNVARVEYGRTRTGNCNPYMVPNLPTNCHSTQVSTDTVLKMCQNRDQCFLEADNTILGEDPCPNVPKYLTIEYTCVDPPTSTSKTTPTTSTSTSTTTTTTTTTRPTTTSTTTTTTTTRPTTTSTTTRRTTTPTTTRTTTTPTTTRTTTTPTTTTTRTTTTPTTTRTTTTPTTTTTRTTTTPTTTRSTTTPTTTTTTTQATTTPASRPFVPFNAPQGAQVCHDYLVTAQPGVPDNQLTASSIYNLNNPLDNFGPDRARLFSDAARDSSTGVFNNGAWSPNSADQQQYIQVQLNAPSIVRGVATQGRHVDPNTKCCTQHVTKYRVMYSLDCVNYETVNDANGTDMIFTGNTDQDTVVTNMLPCPVMARCIRLNPLSWNGHPSLRFDLLGCAANTADLGSCPPGWQERPGSNDCYIITDINDMRTRDNASAQCQLKQGQLVKIDSVAERDWLRQKMAVLRQTQGQHHFWTGLSNRPRTDNTGHTWEDHTPLDTNGMPWFKNQPDNSGGHEHCGELWDGDMNDNDCNQHYPYICERPKFWTAPKNIPKPNIQVPTTKTTTTTTTKQTAGTTVAPPIVQPYQRPNRPGSVTKNGFQFASGCLDLTLPTACLSKPAGNYQSCQGCHYFVTCAPSGTFTRPCPANLIWDDNIKTCSMLSSTCGPVIG